MSGIAQSTVLVRVLQRNRTKGDILCVSIYVCVCVYVYVYIRTYIYVYVSVYHV